MSSYLMETASGKWVDALALRPEDVDVEDIFTSLSCLCRYNGHVPLSVGQHCLAVTEMLSLWGRPPIERLRGLMHDAAEAYLMDLIGPHKRRPEFKFWDPLERKVLRSIWVPLGLGDPEEHYTAEIEAADQQVRWIEAMTLSPGRGKGWTSYDADEWGRILNVYGFSMQPYLHERLWRACRDMLLQKYAALRYASDLPGRVVTRA
jgi:hypothetical protein